MTRNFIYIAVLIILGFSSALGQTPTTSQTTSNSQVSLETILTEGEKQTRFYQETFRNLLAEEKKTFEVFNKSGQPREQAVVESTLLIYQSPKDQNISSELRNVIRVDGKSLPDSQKRSDLLFAELQKTSTGVKELEKIQDESLRYDKTLKVNNLTVSEALVLSEKLRPFFNFTLAGTENFQGNEVYVINYQQTKKSPFITINGNNTSSEQVGFNYMGFDLPKSLRNSDVFMRGKLWIDAKTYRIWREERELTIQAPNPVVLLATTLEYHPSEYEILVPKRISMVTNELKKKDNQYTAVNDIRLTFDYSKFRKTETDVRIIDDDQ